MDAVLCYNCNKAIISFDCYLIVIKADGNQYLYDDIDFIEDEDVLLEIAICPHCGVHY